MQFFPPMGMHCFSEHECFLTTGVVPSTLLKPNKEEKEKECLGWIREWGAVFINVILRLVQCMRFKLQSLTWTELVLVPVMLLYAK